MPNYAGTAFMKNYRAESFCPSWAMAVGGQWASTAAITRVTLVPLGGTNFVTGSRVTLYGLS